VSEVRLDVAPAGPLRGELVVPGDKSISHRALLLNALGEGRARVRGLLDGADVAATLAAVRAMGVEVEVGDEVIIRSSGRLREPDDVLHCGNSGTSIRLLAGVVAAEPLFAVLTGDASLRRRPMARVLGPLREMGAAVDGRGGGDRAPIAVRGGALRAMSHDLAIASAQVKTALLLAGRRCGVSVREPSRSRDHTERMLAGMGADIRDDGGWLRLSADAPWRCIDVDVPGDPSSAAFWLVAGSVIPGSEILLRGVGVNPTRAGVVDALRLMGASLDVVPRPQVGAEPVADITVRAASLRGARIDGDLALRALDELPVLAIAAAFAEGETVIADAAELRVKESDRVARVVAGLRAMGVEVEERPDGMVIQGGAPRGPARIDARGDHRIAMAFAVAGAASPGGVEIIGAEEIKTSYPGFVAALNGLRR
jgi:3-phosphoshikimate 1-carboxyvinyltransferase